MPYKPTGRPSGRPRKTAPDDAPAEAMVAKPTLTTKEAAKKRMKRLPSGGPMGSRTVGITAGPAFGKRRRKDERRRLTLQPNPVA